jgi:hypothetical protein
MDFRYLIFSKADQVVGFSYCQIYPFSAEQSFKSFRSHSESATIGLRLKSVLARLVKFKALVCGNLLLTGQYGFYFLPEFNQRQFSILESAWRALFAKLQDQDQEVTVLFAKEFDLKNSQLVKSSFANPDFYQFLVQPSMVYDVLPGLDSFADYLNALKSKYRLRMNSALKKREKNITLRKLSLQKLQQESSACQQLLDQVIGQSDFKIVDLKIEYLIDLKARFLERFQVQGYYYEEKLIGFMSYFIDQNAIVAHLTGFDLSRNKKFDLYLNMLLQLVRCTIEGCCQSLILSRTALEIKSSVGATPRPMINLLKHRNKSLNLALPHVYSILYQNEEWTQRKPFKEGFSLDGF